MDIHNTEDFDEKFKKIIEKKDNEIDELKI